MSVDWKNESTLNSRFHLPSGKNHSQTFQGISVAPFNDAFVSGIFP